MHKKDFIIHPCLVLAVNFTVRCATSKTEGVNYNNWVCHVGSEAFLPTVTQ